MLRKSLIRSGPQPLFGSRCKSAIRLAHSRACWAHLAFWPLILVACLPAFAQHALTWHTIDGGGGSSTGGVYALSATIGQPGAGVMRTGGAYSLTGGFWALPMAIPNPDAPTLTIVFAGPGQARISWAPNTAGFVLQERVGLSTGTWTDAPSGTNNPALVPATLPARFYRLANP